MDFAAALSSDSVKEQSRSAIFLRSKGADGADQSSKAWLELKDAFEWWQRDSPVEWLKDELQWLFP